MRVYIAGPIASHHDGNRIAFARIARWLKVGGHTPVNPHDVAPHEHKGRLCPPGPAAGEDRAHTTPCYMRAGLAALLTCDAIYMLPGWEKSGGARIEYLIAVHVCGIPRFDGGSVTTAAPPKSVRDAFYNPAIDAAYLDRQREWSAATFGPGDRAEGVLDHMAKEAQEVRDAIAAGKDPLPEWVDLIILAFDGAWRCGAFAEEIIDEIREKQSRNEARTWPDWRAAEPGKAIEHDRTKPDAVTA